jgi:hypothetical protein
MVRNHTRTPATAGTGFPKLFGFFETPGEFADVCSGRSVRPRVSVSRGIRAELRLEGLRFWPESTPLTGISSLTMLIARFIAVLSRNNRGAAEEQQRGGNNS